MTLAAVVSGYDQLLEEVGERVVTALQVERDRTSAELDDLRGQLAFGSDARLWQALEKTNDRLASLAVSVVNLHNAVSELQVRVHAPTQDER